MNDVKKWKILTGVLSAALVVCLIVIATLATLLLSRSESKVVVHDEMIEVTTPYAKLEYPKEWEDYLLCETNESHGNYAVDFIADVDGSKMPLFTVYFGDGSEGTLIGYVGTGEKRKAFSVKGSDFMPDDQYTDKQKDIFFGMSESINDVIKSVENTENFSSAGY